MTSDNQIPLSTGQQRALLTIVGMPTHLVAKDSLEVYDVGDTDTYLISWQFIGTIPRQRVDELTED